MPTVESETQTSVLLTGVFIFFLTLFLDLLELSFARILWFMRTLRFWLYFVLHFGLSCLAAYIIHRQIPSWYLLGPAGTFLGVSVLSNLDVRVAGYSFVPIAEFFVSIKAKMFEQAAEDKARQVVKARLVERVDGLSLERIEAAHRAALIGTGRDPQKVQRTIDKAKVSAKKNEQYYKAILISQLVKANLSYVEDNIDAWEQEASSPPEDT